MWPALPLLVSALVSGTHPAMATHARAKLVFENSGVAPGETLTAALVFDIDRSWHLYWDGQNDTGQPPTFDRAKLPAGVTVGDPQWPAPERQVLEGDIVDHIYATKLVILLPVTVAKDAKPGSMIKLDLPLQWMECASTCQLGEATVSGSFKVVAKAADAKPTADAKVIETARAALPARLPADGSVKVEVGGDTLTITAAGADGLTFMPASGSTPLAHLASEPVAKGPTLTAKLKPDPKAGSAAVVGILQVVKGKAKYWYSVDTRQKSAESKDKSNKTEPAHPASGTTPGR